MSLSRREWTCENVFLGEQLLRPDRFLPKTSNMWANTGHTVWKAGDLNKVSTSNKPNWTDVSQITSCFCTKHFSEVNLHSRRRFAPKTTNLNVEQRLIYCVNETHACVTPTSPLSKLSASFNERLCCSCIEHHRDCCPVNTVLATVARLKQQLVAKLC